ncbi:spermidine synthase [Motilibacter deserti]|uniref:Methyltransferase domain-containing protein n=1 Tax=Motilibacter deserti TaxID=2714956 RepID=A0ABX0GS96_9ACTN|nr:fused MFS/spermidine synthase [Motilibacter deserti]NHC13751.1 methyltransferase domain-containing protein [Motilibacter deserti]
MSPDRRPPARPRIVGATRPDVFPEPGRHELTGATAELLRDLDVDEGWVLLIDGVPSSYVDLEDPTRLGFEYMDWIGSVLDGLAPDGLPLDTVHLGGGACSLARYVAATRPRSRQLVLERDPRLLELARDVLGLHTGPLLRTKAREARAGLAKERDASFDVVIRDAFAGVDVPDHLLTVQFLRDAARVLRPGGTYVANLADRPPLPLARREAASALAVWPHVALISEPSVLRGRRNGNVVLVASAAPLPIDALLRRTSSGAAPARMLFDERLVGFVAGAEPYLDPEDGPGGPAPDAQPGSSSPERSTSAG